MRRLILILLLCPLLLGAYYRFDPAEPYNLNGVETACDTVYLKWWYNGDSSVTHVITTPVSGETGLYQFDSTVAEAGWYRIRMLFVDNSEDVRYSYTFMYEAQDTLPDTAGLMHEADTAGIAADVYAHFTDGSNEDQFKATGFSTFDPASDSVLVDGSAFGSLNAIIDSASYDSASMHGWYGMFFVTGIALVDSVEAGVDNKFTFTGTDVHATLDGEEVDVGDLGLQDSAEAAIDAKFTFNNDSVLAYGSFSGGGSGDSNTTAGIQYGCSLAIAQNLMDSSTYVAAVAAETSDTLNAHADDYKADVSGLSTFDAASDLVAVGEIKANVLGDSTLQDAATEYTGGSSAQIESLHVILSDSIGNKVWHDHDNRQLTMFDEDSTLIDMSSVNILQAAIVGQVQNLADGSIEAADITVAAAQKIASYVDASCAGTGTYSCSLWVQDTLHDAFVQGVVISVNNQAEDGTVSSLVTNANGFAVFSLDNGDYRASAASPPGTYSPADFTVSSAALRDTIYGYLPTVSSPSSPDVATVYGNMVMPDGDTLSNMTVLFELEGYASVIDTSTDRAVAMKAVQTTTNAAGYFEINLLKNENLIAASNDSIVHPWWTVTVHSSLLTTVYRGHIFIDADSTTFNIGIKSDAVQFGR